MTAYVVSLQQGVNWLIWCVRVCMCVFLCSFIYETEHHNGIAELLEILGRYAVFATRVILFVRLAKLICSNDCRTSECRHKGSDIPSLDSLLMVAERMSSSRGLVGDSKGIQPQLPLVECTFPPLLFLHRCPFFSFCLRRTCWMGWCYGGCMDWRVKGNPGLPGKMAVKSAFMYCRTFCT